MCCFLPADRYRPHGPVTADQEEEPGDGAGEQGALAQPCEQDAQARPALDLPQAHPCRADQRKRQAEAGQGDAAEHGLRQCASAR